MYIYTRHVRNLSGHFEYLDNRLCGLNVTWHPIRRYVILLVWTETFLQCHSFGSASPLNKLVYYIRATFTMTIASRLFMSLQGNYYITRVLVNSSAVQIWLPGTHFFFLKIKLQRNIMSAIKENVAADGNPKTELCRQFWKWECMVGITSKETILSGSITLGRTFSLNIEQ